jgi:uncharacterized membrane protein YfcA
MMVPCHGLIALAGLAVGLVVGLTGVGGGSLMTPVLVLLFGVAPHLAVGTDLLNASISKVFGTALHAGKRTVDWPVVGRLALGSLPAALLTLAWMNLTHAAGIRDRFIFAAIGWTLLLTAAGMLLRARLPDAGPRLGPRLQAWLQPLQAPLTVLAGAVLGVLVTLTSIGAGALGTVALVYLYPLRMDSRRLVGTSLAFGIPLALLAGLGHLRIGNVDFDLLLNLLAGSVPGMLLGTRLGSRMPQRWLRGVIAVVLGLVAVRMLVH